jgi:flagellar export protein FliJ
VKKFNFRLRPIQRLKILAYEMAERRVMEQQNTLTLEKETLSRLHQAKSRVREQFASYHRILDFSMMEVARGYERGIDRDIRVQDMRVQEAYQELQERQRQSILAMREKKVYEKLEERERRKFRKERQDFEQKQIDDVAGIRNRKAEAGRV